MRDDENLMYFTIVSNVTIDICIVSDVIIAMKGNHRFSCDVIIVQNKKLPILLARVFRKVENAIHWIYQMDSVVQSWSNRVLKFWCHHM